MNIDYLQLYSVSSALKNYCLCQTTNTIININSQSYDKKYINITINNKRYRIKTDISNTTNCIKDVLLYCVKHKINIMFDCRIFNNIRLSFDSFVKDYYTQTVHYKNIYYDVDKSQLIYDVSGAKYHHKFNINIDFKNLSNFDFKTIVDDYPEEFL